MRELRSRSTVAVLCATVGAAAVLLPACGSSGGGGPPSAQLHVSAIVRHGACLPRPGRIAGYRGSLVLVSGSRRVQVATPKDGRATVALRPAWYRLVSPLRAAPAGAVAVTLDGRPVKAEAGGRYPIHVRRGHGSTLRIVIMPRRAECTQQGAAG